MQFAYVTFKCEVYVKWVCSCDAVKQRDDEQRDVCHVFPLFSGQHNTSLTDVLNLLLSLAYYAAAKWQSSLMHLQRVQSVAFHTLSCYLKGTYAVLLAVYWQTALFSMTFRDNADISFFSDNRKTKQSRSGDLVCCVGWLLLSRSIHAITSLCVQQLWFMPPWLTQNWIFYILTPVLHTRIQFAAQTSTTSYSIWLQPSMTAPELMSGLDRDSNWYQTSGVR